MATFSSFFLSLLCVLPSIVFSVSVNHIATWRRPDVTCATQYNVCSCSGYVVYSAVNGEGGKIGQWVDGSINCTNAAFGSDPASGLLKQCTCQSTFGNAKSVAYHAGAHRAFVVAENSSRVDVIDLAVPSDPLLVQDWRMNECVPSYVAVHGNLVAVACIRPERYMSSLILFFLATGDQQEPVREVSVAYGPKMLAFSEDGTRLLIAHGAAPCPTYGTSVNNTVDTYCDPPGVLTLLDVSNNVSTHLPPKTQITLNDFDNYAGQTATRAMPAGANLQYSTQVSKEVEFDFVQVGKGDNRHLAYAVMATVNCFAILDMTNALVLVDIKSFEHRQYGSVRLDVSNADGGIHMAPRPGLWGLLQPSQFALEWSGDRPFLLTANSGSFRNYTVFKEAIPVSSIPADHLDPSKFGDDIPLVLEPSQLGSLFVSPFLGADSAIGQYGALFTFGTRSFSVVDGVNGNVLWDSGDTFESLAARTAPLAFNSLACAQPTFDNSSVLYGPRPYAITTGVVDGNRYAFVSLYEQGGIAIFNIDNLLRPKLENYVTSRNFLVDVSADLPVPHDAGNIGPIDLTFIPAHQSPNGKALLLVVNEQSGTLEVLEFPTPAADLAGPIIGIVIALIFAVTAVLCWYRRARQKAAAAAYQKTIDLDEPTRKNGEYGDEGDEDDENYNDSAAVASLSNEGVFVFP